MSSSVPISNKEGVTAPTPVNTPLNTAPIQAGLSRPTVPDISEEPEGTGAEPTDSNPALTTALSSLVHGRLADLVGKSSGYIESLPVPVKRNVEALKGIQVKQIELQNLYKRECLELEKKYLGLAQPLYERRHAIISATAAPTDEEIKAGEEESLKDDEDYQALPAATAEEKSAKAGIPEFWLTALRNHIGLSDVITERDEGALKFLTNITLSYLESPAIPPPMAAAEDKKDSIEGKPGFVLHFHFDSNEFFTNTVLTKTYLYQDEIGYSGDFVYDRAIGTTIDWKEDKDLTKEFEIRKQRNKNTNRTRLVRKSKPTESFFNFFSPPTPPSDEDIDEGRIEDEELEELEEKLEVDYQIGEDIKEKVIPRAIDYFTGKALEYDAMDESDSEGYSDEDDEDEDDDEDSDDSDDDIPVRRRGPPKVKTIGVRKDGQNPVNPEECKQQ